MAAHNQEVRDPSNPSRYSNSRTLREFTRRLAKSYFGIFYDQVLIL
jgi:hypothetical protein